MVYCLSDKAEFHRDFELRAQIRAASVSAMTNLAEGFDNRSKREFARFLSFSSRSASEVQSLLYAALDASYITRDEFATHFEQARRVHALIGGLRASINRQIEASMRPTGARKPT